MKTSALPWFAPLVAATCLAASPAVTPVLPRAEVQLHPVVLTAEVVPADLLESLAPDLLGSLGSTELSEVAGDAAAGFFGLGYFFAEVIYAFNSVVSVLLSPLSWVPIVGSLAASLIWTPINLVEQLIWPFLVGTIYYPYYPYYPYLSEATDPGLPVELSQLPGLADFSLPDTALSVDALEVGDVGDLGDAFQAAGAALLDMLI
ncbi:hypothetical protein [Mycobacterium sp. UM_WGJ]|uniref:hypothetical protein n=1 Tax=Mycobacterium sp. UM_WGJ TaxID=1370120 RepID=UPI000463E3EE|nr:hypothetical protein [Mycobacterium sp. UM_WGJ]